MHSTPPPNRSRWETAGVVAFVVMAVGIAGRLVVERLRHGHVQRQNVWDGVFAPAAEAFVAGADMYTETSGFRYPPLAAALMVPFTWLGPLVGSIVWRWVLLLGLGLAVRNCLRAGFPFVMTSRERGVFWLLLVPAVIGSANIGQPNTLILGGMLAATLAALQGRYGAASLGVLGNTTLKVYPFAHGLVLAALRPRLIPYLVLGLGLVLALPLLLQRPGYVLGQYQTLIDMLANEDRTHDVGQAFRAYRDLRLLGKAVNVPISDSLFRLLQVVGGAGIAVVCLWLQRRRTQAPVVFQHALALTICWCLLLGPATERVTYALLGPAIAWPLLQDWRLGGARACWPWLLVNGLYLGDHLVPSLSRQLQEQQPWTRCMLPMTTLLATGLLLLRALRDGQHAPRDGMRTMESQPTAT